MTGVIQRALGALLRLFMTLTMFGVNYTVWNAQFDPAQAILTPSSCCAFSSMSFPALQLAGPLLNYFDLLKNNITVTFIFVLLTYLFWFSLYERSSFGMISVLALGVIGFGLRRLLYRAAKNTVTRRSPEPTPSDAAAAVPDQHTEPEQPAKSDQPRSDNPSDDPPAPVVAIPSAPAAEEHVQPKHRARSMMRTLGLFLLKMVILGVIAMVVHSVIDVTLKDRVLNPAPKDRAPRLKAEVIFQANKTEIPIPVPIAEFTPTGTFGSPCQAAPTPTPVGKYMVTAMSTTMPTTTTITMSAPTPSAMPEPASRSEQLAVSDKPIDVLNRLFDFDMPDPKPLLKGYFGLPTQSQYIVIVFSLLVLWCLSKPIIAVAACLLVVAFTYFVSAAVLALLLIYGFTAEQSIVIVVPADLALIGSIWWAFSLLRNFARTSWSNAAEVANLRCVLKQTLAYIQQGMDGTIISVSILGYTVDTLQRSIDSTIDALKDHAKIFRDVAYDLDCLDREVGSKADLEQTTRILEQLSQDIAKMQTSKGDASLVRKVQKSVDSLDLKVKNLPSEVADAASLKSVQEELKRITREVDGLPGTKEDVETLKDLVEKLKDQTATVTGMLNTQDKLAEDLEAVKKDLGKARTDIASLRTASNRHDSSIPKLEESSKKAIKNHNDVNSEVKNNQKRAKDDISELKKQNAAIKEENTNLRRDFDILNNTVTEMKERMAAIENGQKKNDGLLKELQGDVTSTDQKVDQLRSHTDSQHEQITEAHRKLDASVNTRFEDSTKAVNKLERETTSNHAQLEKMVKTEVKKVRDGIVGEIDGHLLRMNDRLELTNDDLWDVLKRVEDLESRPNGSIPEDELDEVIRENVEEYMENFVVSDEFRAAINDAQLTLKKQSQRDRLRFQVQAAMEELLDSEDVQQNIYANFRERQNADNGLSRDSFEVVSGDTASSPGFDPSTSHAAPDNTTGNDDPLGDSPGVINGGRATLPGDMSSDDTTTPTIPEESTIPDDVDDHHGTRGVPLGEATVVLLRRGATSRGGSTSDGPSGDGDSGPRPSGEGDDDMLGPEQWEANEPRELGNFTDDQVHDRANPQPGGEQDEETDEEETDDETDDDADHDGDDDDSDDDDGPPGPPPGSGGFHGHNGPDDDDDDDQDADNGGAPRPFTGIGASRGAPGLSNSRFAADPPSNGGNTTAQHGVGGAHPGTSKTSASRKGMGTRERNYFTKKKKTEKTAKAKKREQESAEKEKQRQSQSTSQQNDATQRRKKQRGGRGSGVNAKEWKRQERERRQNGQQE